MNPDTTNRFVDKRKRSRPNGKNQVQRKRKFRVNEEKSKKKTKSNPSPQPFPNNIWNEKREELHKLIESLNMPELSISDVSENYGKEMEDLKKLQNRLQGMTKIDRVKKALNLAKRLMVTKANYISITQQSQRNLRVNEEKSKKKTKSNPSPQPFPNNIWNEKREELHKLIESLNMPELSISDVSENYGKEMEDLKKLQNRLQGMTKVDRVEKALNLVKRLMAR
eukprot:g5687.t1